MLDRFYSSRCLRHLNNCSGRHFDCIVEHILTVQCTTFLIKIISVCQYLTSLRRKYILSRIFGLIGAGIA
jgi:hypothetical protein